MTNWLTPCEYDSSSHWVGRIQKRTNGHFLALRNHSTGIRIQLLTCSRNNSTCLVKTGHKRTQPPILFCAQHLRLCPFGDKRIDAIRQRGHTHPPVHKTSNLCSQNQGIYTYTWRITNSIRAVRHNSHFRHFLSSVGGMHRLSIAFFLLS